ncbi:MAG: hypothetical protein WCZ67_07500 [Bacteroidales bacterium]|jgi:hypothetical protein
MTKQKKRIVKKNAKGTLTLLLVILSFCSCLNKQNQILMDEMTLLKSQEIIIPTKSLTVYTKDHLDNTAIKDNNIQNAELKFIVYSDSVECGPCYMNQLTGWLKYIYYAQEHNNKLGFYFIFSPRVGKLEEVIKSFNEIYFEYPIYVDENRIFEKQNPTIPKDKRMHCFLLDKDNKVILIGNPTRNKKVESLFFEIIEKSTIY